MHDGPPNERAPPKPYTPPATPQGKINLSDPDSKLVHGMRGWVQGYNAQAVCNEQHLILAAEVMTASPDFGHLGPMLAAARAELAARRRRRAARGRARRRRLLAPGADERDHRRRHPGADPARLQPPQEQAETAGLGRRRLRLHALGARDRPRQRALPQRGQPIEPIFGDTKHNRGFTRFPDAAAPPHGPNGASSPPPTTSASSTST